MFYKYIFCGTPILKIPWMYFKVIKALLCFAELQESSPLAFLAFEIMKFLGNIQEIIKVPASENQALSEV